LNGSVLLLLLFLAFVSWRMDEEEYKRPGPWLPHTISWRHPIQCWMFTLFLFFLRQFKSVFYWFKQLASMM
jgi:hypothetical protein